LARSVAKADQRRCQQRDLSTPLPRFLLVESSADRDDVSARMQTGNQQFGAMTIRIPLAARVVFVLNRISDAGV
jgi:hypothetical protein